MIFLFDFDGTLMPYRGKFPRQTRHVLRQLTARGHTVGIVTNNIMAVSMLRELGLVPYVGSNIVIQRSRTETRVELIARWFALIMPLEAFYYFDDRVDQVEAVQQAFRGTCLGSFHVRDPQRLCDITHSLFHVPCCACVHLNMSFAEEMRALEQQKQKVYDAQLDTDYITQVDQVKDAIRKYLETADFGLPVPRSIGFNDVGRLLPAMRSRLKTTLESPPNNLHVTQDFTDGKVFWIITWNE